MPLTAPGNRLFRAYYVSPDPIGCASCGRETYETASGRCPWCREPLHVEPEAVLA